MHKERNGFALVVVLVGLAVLATLFSVIQLRSLSAVTRYSTDRTLLAREAEGTVLLRLAGAALARDPAVTRVDLPAPWTGRLVLQNTAGLVDLNMALPDLIDAFARGLDLSPGAVDRLRDWRRGGLRLHPLRISPALRAWALTARLTWPHLPRCSPVARTSTRVGPLRSSWRFWVRRPTRRTLPLPPTALPSGITRPHPPRRAILERLGSASTVAGPCWSGTEAAALG